MFWANSNNNNTVELRKKNLFVARFVGTNSLQEKNLTLLVKKFDAPSINVGFERGLANNYVHYFQQGEINWEPINVTFVDVTDQYGNEETGLIPKWRTIFFDYFEKAPVARENRTSVLDVPIFCSNISIENYSTFYQQPQDDEKVKYFSTSIDTFTIYNPRITKISFGSFDYSSDEANEITVTFVPEWCDIGVV